MSLYKCKFCGVVCHDGKSDPGNRETADEHVIFKHYEQLLTTFFEKQGGR